MDPQQQIFSLMAAAEDQQKAAQKAIEGIQAERQALARERQELAALGDRVKKATIEAVGGAVRDVMAGASSEAAKALGEASRPILGGLSGVVRASRDAETSLKNAGRWFAWKWAALAGGALAGVVLVSYLAMAWQLYQVRSARAEREALAAEIVTLRAGLAELERQGARIELSRCGEGAAARLCVRAATNQGDGVRNWRGPWGNERAHYVIPHGY